jgi:hypothetical protein
MKVYKYGMRLRGFSIGCQPMQNFYKREDGNKKYCDIITYTKPLTKKEIKDYSLDFIGEVIK